MTSKAYFPDFAWSKNEDDVVQFESAIRKVYRKKWYDIFVRTSYKLNDEVQIGELVQRHLHQVYMTDVNFILNKKIIDTHGLGLCSFQGSESERINELRKQLIKPIDNDEQNKS